MLGANDKAEYSKHEIRVLNADKHCIVLSSELYNFHFMDRNTYA